MNEPKREVQIDWTANFIDSIVGQILNNDELKKNYVNILALALMKIEARLSYEAAWVDPQKYQGVLKNDVLPE